MKEILDPGEIYKINQLIVNRPALVNWLEKLDQHLADGIVLYRELDNIIKQGTTLKKGD
jgi:hypothetical protein